LAARLSFLPILPRHHYAGTQITIYGTPTVIDLSAVTEPVRGVPLVPSEVILEATHGLVMDDVAAGVYPYAPPLPPLYI